jgi:MFS transporter, DHA1 family, multidrug resistance protein
VARTGGGRVVTLLAALCALPPLSIDMALPALPSMGAALGVGAGGAALSISLFMAGFATTPLAYGALSDRFGRRKPLLCGLVLFAAGGLLCALAASLPLLLAARVLQGAGAGAGPTLAFAASRDRLEGAPLARRLALLTMLLNTAPVIAPSLGTAVLAAAGWRSIFAVLGGFGVVLAAAALIGFAETRAGRGGAGPWADIRALLGRRAVVRHGFVYAASAGAMFAYVSTSSLLLIGVLGAGAALYAGLFAVTACGIVAGAWFSGVAARHARPSRVIAAGLGLLLAGPAAAAILLRTAHPGLAAVVAAMLAATFGYGLVAPAAAHATLEEVPEMAGTAAALMNSAQMACMSLSSLLAGILLPTIGPLATPLVMAGFALSAALALARR